MIPGLGIFRRTITFVLCAGSFWAGMQAERLLYANQMLDLCYDDTAPYFRKHGQFHPDCEALEDAAP